MKLLAILLLLFAAAISLPTFSLGQYWKVWKSTSVIPKNSDVVLTSKIDSPEAIGKGLRGGYQMVHVSAHNSDVDGAEDIWDGGGAYTGFPVSDLELVEVLSSSGDDTNAAGLGARTVFIGGLDGNYDYQSEIIELAGTGAVESEFEYRRVFDFYVVSSGVNNTAFNVGTLTVRHSTTTANVFATIEPGENITHSGCRTIPAGKIGLLKYIEFVPDKNNNTVVEVSIFSRELGNAPKYLEVSMASDAVSHLHHFWSGLKFEEKTDFCPSVRGVSTGNIDVHAVYDLLLMDKQ